MLTKSQSKYNVWLGEWTYIVKNEVHSFDIIVQKKKLIYTEDMGGRTIYGKVSVESNNQARIISKTMNFEIQLVRRDEDSHVARYRQLGSKKWTKEISLMKVDEIGFTSEDSKLSVQDSASRTLANTWRNATSPLPRYIPQSQSAPSMRGCDIRKQLSERHVAVSSTMPDFRKVDKEETELFRLNSQRKKIGFLKEVGIKEILAA